jgi:hypothetical protein
MNGESSDVHGPFGNEPTPVPVMFLVMCETCEKPGILVLRTLPGSAGLVEIVCNMRC